MDLHILALETSSSLCGVALLSVSGGQVHVRKTAHDATGEHAERLLPMVDQLLTEANIQRTQLKAIAFGQGPGGFTGLRVACGVAQGMAFALDLPVIPVVSLLAVATLESGDEPVRVVVQDARMGEVYVAAYGRAAGGSVQSDEWSVLHEPVLLSADDVDHWIQLQTPRWSDIYGSALSIKVMGDALDAYSQLLLLDKGPNNAVDAISAPAPGRPPMVRLGSPLRASAEAVARLALRAWEHGQTLPPEQASPLYVRDKVAYTTLERQSGFGGNPKAGPVAVAIEPMTLDCLDDVVSIEQTVQSFPWTKGNFSDALQAGYGAWVARQAGKVIGFSLVMFAPDVAHLLLIAVAPGEQRKGVGHLLLRHCEHESRVRDLPAVILEVRPSNQQAVAFYQHRGFNLLSTRKGYYPQNRGEREDAWILRKDLQKVGAHG